MIPPSESHLLLFNLATDADDPILGFTSEWINRLADHYTRIDVITMRAGRLAVAPNVCVASVGKERGLSEAARALNFYRLLSARLRSRRYVACFAHMMPLFAVLGAPLLQAARVPITLWYTHRQITPLLRGALAVSRRVVTAVPDSFPIPSAKTRPLGHGIDTDYFSPADPAEASGGLHNIVQVARLMPIKHQATLLRAVAALPDARAVFVGDVLSDQPDTYRRELEMLAADLGIAERVVFAGQQPRAGVLGWYRRAAVAVNLSPPGLFDKAALEGMAAGVPTVVSNPAFDPLLGDHVDQLRSAGPDDHDGLSQRLRDLLDLPPEDRAALATDLRARVIAQHSLDRLIPRLVGVLNGGAPETGSP
ncbi:MAG: glycosyltransferase family 4 protein [Chloroflexi bacterium]|nr:glycosyltransferase family 4 protein [Chloroflexota bacterium]